ncbi:hypothetical protein Tco_1351452 [Tanacetum coccineum]
MTRRFRKYKLIGLHVIFQRLMAVSGGGVAVSGHRKSFPVVVAGFGERTSDSTEDLDAYDSNCYDVSNAKEVLMVNLSNYGSYVISEVPHSEPYHHDMDNQSVHAMQDFEQTPVVDFTNNEITTAGAGINGRPSAPTIDSRGNNIDKHHNCQSGLPFHVPDLRKWKFREESVKQHPDKS